MKITERTTLKGEIAEYTSQLIEGAYEQKLIATGALGNIGWEKPVYVKDAIGPLTECLEDPVPEVRGNAIVALGKIGAKRPHYVAKAIPILKNLSKDDSNKEVCENALKTLDYLAKMKKEHSVHGGEEGKRLDKLQRLLTVTNRVRIDDISALLDLDRANILDLVLEWGEEYPIKIEGDDLLVEDQKIVNENIDDLMDVYITWREAQQRSEELQETRREKMKEIGTKKTPISELSQKFKDLIGKG